MKTIAHSRATLSRASRLLGDKYTCFIGADNKKIGKAAGEWIVKALGGKGNVV